MRLFLASTALGAVVLRGLGFRVWARARLTILVSLWADGSFRKLWVPYFGVLIIRILLFRVLYWGPLFSETPR